jgi:hypothetical protein
MFCFPLVDMPRCESFNSQGFINLRILSWAAVFTALQSYLNEDKNRAADSQPAWISMVTACIGLLTCYSDLVLPRRAPPVPKRAVQSAVEMASETISSVISSATQ